MLHADEMGMTPAGTQPKRAQHRFTRHITPPLSRLLTSYRPYFWVFAAMAAFNKCARI